MSKYIAGIDIGGTTIKIGLISQAGEIMEKWEIPTDTSDQGKHIVKDIWESIVTKLASIGKVRDDILGLGVGAPGFIDGDTGFVFEAVNIGWKDLDLAGQLKEMSNLPVFVQNDANIAVLGENWKGAGNQAQNVIAITLGTGVGGGIIANGDIVDGENGMAGEIGHFTIDPEGHLCNCGRRGCLETIVSATGMVRQAVEQARQYPEGKLAKLQKQKGSISAKDIADLAAEGDTPSIRIIKKNAEILGRLISNMGTVINPSKVLIGGGVSKAGDMLIDEIAHAFHGYALKRVSDICEIKQAELGNDAGIIGGAFLVKQRLLDAEFDNNPV
ncbi:ROK family glucokinase [Virgibacillus xinjiangensis]|uniref:Glucokinase n=1 Tax=Virgibacillus xinjiangensis TaxID=393090 RepID=A0ABV7CSG9_9BACI